MTEKRAGGAHVKQPRHRREFAPDEWAIGIIAHAPGWARTALLVVLFAACVAVIGAVDPQAVR